jgi:tetratricopeptide (TPR) repeat protein
VAPQRWVDAEGPLSVLIRDAAREYQAELDPRAALRPLPARAPRFSRGRVLVPSLAFGLAGVLLALLGHSRLRSPDLLAEPEPERSALRALRPAEPAPPPSTSPAPAKPALEPARASAPRPHAALAQGAHELAPDVAAPAPSEPSQDCLGFARLGDATKAEQCFEAQAAGQNLSAEVALYELARLRRDMLGEPASALSALDDYTQRFPRGYLSGEVLFSRLELLLKLGRSAEVLRASDELLASASGKERALEIHFLRGNVFAHSLADPASAAREYAQAALAPGRVGDDAAYLAAVNLDASGDATSASAAFERYLKRSGGRHQAEAEARLNTLRAAPTNEPR